MEWSDWLTPRNHKRRYDTLFFMCFSESKPEAKPDLIEVTESQVRHHRDAVAGFCIIVLAVCVVDNTFCGLEDV